MAHIRTPAHFLGSSLGNVAIVGLFLLVTFLFQWQNQAYLAEFGSEGDEAAHYVTGLMVRQYVLDGMPENPYRYAERYYVHYPKVAFGAWPPLYHLASGAWMLAFSGDRASILMLMALLSACTAFLITRFLATETGEGAGIIGGLIFLTLPAVQKLSTKVMMDTMVALLSCAAVFCFARYLERERTRDAALFGLLAAAAILTKYNALALAFVPLLSVVFTGNYRLLKRGAFWLPAGIVVVLAGPWYVKMNHLVWYAAQPVPGFGDIPYSLWRHAVGLTTVLKGLLLLTAILGIADWWRNRYRDVRWAAPAAQIAAVLLFHNFFYIGYDERYLSQAVPALVAFALKGIACLAALVSARIPNAAVAGAALALLPLIHLGTPRDWDPRKTYHGYTQVAAHIQDESARRVLVSAETTGEGMLVAEMAMREPKPGRAVLRASKTFASASWMKQDYKLLHDADSAMRHLTEKGVELLVVDRGEGPALPHHAMVKEMVDRYGHGWKRLATVGSVDIYRLPRRQGDGMVQVDLKHTLGKSVAD